MLQQLDALHPAAGSLRSNLLLGRLGSLGGCRVHALGLAACGARPDSSLFWLEKKI
jgi:hypothetical protein